MDRCKSTLSLPLQTLLQAMQRIYFGTIDNLTVRRGEPCFDPPPKVTREIKLGVDVSNSPPPPDANFELKRAVIDLFEHLATLPNGTAVSIEVRHGLPSRLIVAGMEIAPTGAVHGGNCG